MALKNNLREFMIERQLTVPVLATKTGISPNTIHSIIWNKRRTRDNTMDILSEFFCVNRNSLFYYDDSVGPTIYIKKKGKCTNNIKQYMELNNINQSELAEATELNRCTINYVINNRTSPNSYTKYKIAKYFKVDIDDIFSYNE